MFKNRLNRITRLRFQIDKEKKTKTILSKIHLIWLMSVFVILYSIDRLISLLTYVKNTIALGKLKSDGYYATLRLSGLQAEIFDDKLEVWKNRLVRVNFQIFRFINFFFIGIWVTLSVCRIVNYDFMSERNDVIRYSYLSFAYLVLTVPSIVLSDEYSIWMTYGIEDTETAKRFTFSYIAVWIFAYVAELMLILSFLM